MTLGKMIIVILWVFGAIVAKGFWSTLFAIVIPFWGLYLAVEQIARMYGWL